MNTFDSIYRLIFLVASFAMPLLFPTMMWTQELSLNQGRSWEKASVLTENSIFNHTYVRRPVNAHPDFWALWADGDGRQPSESRLYFCNQKGEVFVLPTQMEQEFETPKQIDNP